MAAASGRRLRAFKRWMTSNGVECDEALELMDSVDRGIIIRSKCHLEEGGVVATIPKAACLTIKLSLARELIESAGLDGLLGLTVAVMYERSLGTASAWAGYLQLLPHSEPLPFTWTSHEVDSLLLGTELHKTVKDDKDFMCSDWEECILPLIGLLPSEIDPSYFSVEQYFAAKSLVASRSFEIDEYYGSGMVPLADLFNHKTGAEHVHFTTMPSHVQTDDNDDNSVGGEDDNGGSGSGDDDEEDELEVSNSMDDGSMNENTDNRCSSLDGDEDGCCQETDGNPMVLEMVLVKDVLAGEEVFNTYGVVGNAALLHRYGFTELDNKYDIVNIDLLLVTEWSSLTVSSRHTKSRTSIWRSLGYFGCISQDAEYFEISYDGEPQVELVVLLYIIVLQDDAFDKLNLAVSASSEDTAKSLIFGLSKPAEISNGKVLETNNDILLTESVCKSLLSLADMRESLYGERSLDDDMKLLKSTCSIGQRNLYHSLTLRICERRILRKLRTYAKKGVVVSTYLSKGASKSKRKRLKSD